MRKKTALERINDVARYLTSVLAVCSVNRRGIFAPPEPGDGSAPLTVDRLEVGNYQGYRAFRG